MCDTNDLAITCREYRSNEYQNTGKIEIFKDDDSDFTINLNSKDSFFGTPVKDGSNHYISTTAINIFEDQLIKIWCPCVLSFLDDNKNLYQFSTDSIQEFTYLVKDDINIINNRRLYTKDRRVRI